MSAPPPHRSGTRTAAPPFDAERAPRRILVVRLGAIGDVVRTLPAVGLLRESWPGAHISWVVEDAPAPLLRDHPDVDRVVLLPRRAIQRALRGLRPEALTLPAKHLGELRSLGAELSLDFQSSLKSGLVAWLSGSRVRVGFDRPFDRECSHLFANVRVRLAEARISRVERAARLAAGAGARSGTLRARPPLGLDELDAGRRLLRGLTARSPAVALAPFTSRRQAWKRYPPERWVEVATRLAGSGAGVVLVGGPAELDDLDRMARSAGAGVAPTPALDLREMAGLIAAADAFVGGDTGPMHIAWMMGTPVVAVYGPTDPVVNAPYGEGHEIIAPPRPTGRDDRDKFPGIDPARIAAAVLRRIAPIAPGAAETEP